MTDTSRRDPAAWSHPYDRMTERERDQERQDLAEWRKSVTPSPSWFFPQEDNQND